MYTAIQNNTKVNVNEYNKEAGVITCPCCGSEVIVKQGLVTAHHFAHKSLNDCEFNHQGMSEWHRDWQDKFALQYQEIILKDDKGVKHISDVRVDKVTVEFQHSPISTEEFTSRNEFYSSVGRVVWLFDANECDITVKNDKLVWKHCKSVVSSFKFDNDKVAIFIHHNGAVIKLNDKDVPNTSYRSRYWIGKQAGTRFTVSQMNVNEFITFVHKVSDLNNDMMTEKERAVIEEQVALKKIENDKAKADINFVETLEDVYGSYVSDTLRSMFKRYVSKEGYAYEVSRLTAKDEWATKEIEFLHSLVIKYEENGFGLTDKQQNWFDKLAKKYNLPTYDYKNSTVCYAKSDKYQFSYEHIPVNDAVLSWKAIIYGKLCESRGIRNHKYQSHRNMYKQNAVFLIKDINIRL